ncbi:MAG: hypothetical protein F2817_21330 [Actinobacteria bacterium]|nr:hypothetical protein [Actinomycetota bacterium]
MDNIYLVVLVTGWLNDNPTSYNIIGVFSTEARALGVCRTPNHVLIPMKMNKDEGDETVIAEGAYYPNHEFNTINLEMVKQYAPKVVTNSDINS